MTANLLSSIWGRNILIVSYLSSRLQYIRAYESSASPSTVLYVYRSSRSSDRFCLCSIPPSTAADPTLIASPIFPSDDTQIYVFCQPSAIDCLCEMVSTCVDDVSSRMRANRLSLNPAKTEVLWSSSPRRHHLIPTVCFRLEFLDLTLVRSYGQS